MQVVNLRRKFHPQFTVPLVNTRYQIRELENYGFDKIEVRDNGAGIKPVDAPFMARPHFTSKISRHADLESLATYGFRGEALGSLCAVSSVTMATKTSDEEFGRQYVLDHEGGIVSDKPSHLGNGTTVAAVHLFKSVPVRKQYYNNPKRRREELKRVEDLIMSYGAIRPAVRFSLRHNKSALWQKSKVANQKAALINTWGSGVMSQMQHVQRLDDDSDVLIEGFVPTVTADSQSVTRALPDRCWVAINSRPVTFKEVEKMVKQSYCTAVSRDTTSVRHLVMFLSITLPQHQVDVNLEPNKTRVMLQNKDAVLSVLADALEDVYGKMPDCQPTSTANQQRTFCREDNTTANTTVKVHCPNNRVPHEDLTLGNTRTAMRDGDDLCRDNVNGDTNDGTRAVVNFDQESISEAQHLDLVQTHREVDSIPVHQPDTRTEESSIASTLTNLPINRHQPSSSNSGATDEAQRDFKLNFSIFDDKFDLESLDENEILGAFDETAPGVSDPVKHNVSDHIVKETNDNVTRLDSVTKGEPVNSTLSLTDWSKGRGLTNKDGRPIEPATLLIPQNANEERGLTNQCAPGQLSTNQTSEDSVSLNPNSLELDFNLDCSASTTNLLINATDSVRIPDSTTLGSKSTTSLANQDTASCSTANQNGSPAKRRLSLEEKTGKGIMFDLIGQSPVRRPQTAFAFFSKEIRPQVVESNPRASFMDVTRTVEEKWKQLTQDEKEKYDEMARKDTDRYHNQLKSAQTKLSAKKEVNKGTPSRKKKKLCLPPNQGLIDKMLLSQQQRKLANQHAEPETPDIYTVDVSFDLIGLERYLKRLEIRNTDVDQRLHLIGQLASHGVWLARRGNQVVVFNQYRVEETLLYHRLLSHHVLPCQPVDVPIVLSPIIVGGADNWNALLGMSMQDNPPDPAMYFTDERLTANGFELKQTIDTETREVKVQVITMATTINYYGIGDLQEILRQIALEPSVALSHCRPLKVTNYLKGEAVRMARGLPLSMQREDVQDIIQRMQQLPSHCQRCLHNQPFEYPLHQIPEPHS